MDQTIDQMDKALFHFKKWEACQPEWYPPVHSRAGMGMVLSKITGSECLHALLQTGCVGLTDGQSFKTAQYCCVTAITVVISVEDITQKLLLRLDSYIPK